MLHEIRSKIGITTGKPLDFSSSVFEKNNFSF